MPKASTLQLVSEALLQAGVLTFSSLMTLTLNKKRKLDAQMCFYLLGNGFSLARSSVLCRVARSSL
jgi:hypothetical protein